MYLLAWNEAEELIQPYIALGFQHIHSTITHSQSRMDPKGIGVGAGHVGPVKTGPFFGGDNDIHYSFCSETAPETISEGLKLKIFLGGHAPRPP